jgi:hypothetical protein
MVNQVESVRLARPMENNVRSLQANAKSEGIRHIGKVAAGKGRQCNIIGHLH